MFHRFLFSILVLSTAARAANTAVLLIPADGQTNVPANLTAVWSGGTAQKFSFSIGTAPLAEDVFYTGEIRQMSASVKLQPGQRYCATLWSFDGVQWTSSTATFTTGTGHAVMSFPAHGQTGVATTASFSWNAVADTTGYVVTVGTAPGASDVFAQTVTTNSVTVSNLLPTTTYYVRLTTLKAGQASFMDSTFTTGNGGSDTAHMTYPAEGATFVNIGQPFTWTTVSSAQKYYLHIGTAPWPNNVVFDSGELAEPTVQIPTGLRASGQYYAYLSTEIGGGWTGVQSSFTVGDRALMTNPADENTNADPAVPFSWTAFPGAQSYYLCVGTAAGQKDVYDGGETADTAKSVPNLSAGQTYYVRLYTHIEGGWRYADTSFRAGTGISHLIQPADGNQAVFPGSPFSWSAISDALAYYLTVGTAAGLRDVYDGGQVQSQSALVPNLAPGVTYYTRLYTWKPDGWHSSDTTFAVSAQATAPVSIQTNALLPSTTSPFFSPLSWTPTAGASAYLVNVGSAAGGSDIYAGAVSSATSVSVPGLGFGKTYCVRIWSNSGGQWSYTDQTLHTQAVSDLADAAGAKQAFYSMIQQTAAAVRQMASIDNQIVANTALSAWASDVAVTLVTCSQYAQVTVNQLTGAGVAARIRGLTLTGTSTESHTVVEVYDPFNDKWEVVDPTFGLWFFNEQAGVGPSVAELQQLVNSQQFAAIPFKYITTAQGFYTSNYYLDPITLYANVLPLTAPSFGPQANPAEPFLTAVAASGQPGSYLIRFEQAGAAPITVQDAGNTFQVVPLNGTLWSRAFIVGNGWSIAGAGSYQIFAPKRFLF